MMNANALPPSKRPALLWGIACLILLGVLLSLLPQARLNSSVLAMLPKQTLGAIPPSLNDGFMQRLDRQLVWLVSPGKKPTRRLPAAGCRYYRNRRRWLRSKARWTPTASRHGALSSGSTATA